MAEIAHIHLDAVGGIAGDMFVAAMLDALPYLEDRVMADLAAVLPPECGTPALVPGLSSSIAVLRFALAVPAAGEGAQHGHEHHHDRHTHDHHHDHGHDHHHHHPDHHHHHGHGPEMVQSFRELAARIRAAALSPGTGEGAVALLTRLAEAESRMHRVPLNEVHFHEIADWDSLMDVVAAASIVAAVGAHVTWSVSDLPRGKGLVRTAHGLLPVPAPATLELLRGFAWRDDVIGGERVTPTGAAILAHLVEPQSSACCPPGTLLAVGTGAGTRDLPGMPNILRATIFADNTEHGKEADEVVILEFDVDDMTGEEIAVAADRLRADPDVLDLTLGYRFGKKGRQVADFRLMAHPGAFEKVRDFCFTETSTIGLRHRREARSCLKRSSEAVVVGTERFLRKRVLRPDGTETVKVESDELARTGGLTARRRLKRSAEGEGSAS